MPGAYWLIWKRLAAGPHPAPAPSGVEAEPLGCLIKAGFGSFVDLTEPPEPGLVHYGKTLRERADTVRYRRIPIPDMQVPDLPTMADLLDYLAGELASGHQVYLHCRAGLGRTGTVAACYLVRQGASGNGALRKLAELRRAQGLHGRSPETEGQRRFVRAWHRLDPGVEGM